MEGYLITTAVAVVIFFLCVLLEDWARRTFCRKWRKEQVDMINVDKVNRDCCGYCVFMIAYREKVECCLFNNFVELDTKAFLMKINGPMTRLYKRTKICKKVKP